MLNQGYQLFKLCLKTFIHLADAFFPKRITLAIYVRGHMPLEQLGVKCLAQGHIGVSRPCQDLLA